MTMLNELVGNTLELPRGRDDGRYVIRFDRSDQLILRIGYDADKAIVKKYLDDKRVIAVLPDVHQYKHYHKDGGKSWSARAGVDFYVAVPGSAVEILHEKGYSYPKIKINGHEITLSVTGGGSKDWGDHVTQVASTGINMKSEVFKAILAASIPGMIPGGYKKDFDNDNAKWWKGLLVRKSFKITPGMKIVLGERYSIPGRTDRHLIADNVHASGKIWNAHVEGHPDWRYKVGTSKVDFLATAELNGLPIPNPDDYTR